MSTSVAMPHDLKALHDLLRAWGAPEHLISLDLHLAVDECVTMTATFYATNADGDQIIADDAFVQESARFKLVKVEDRDCTCHPDEAPKPCARRYALSDCLKAAKAVP